MNGAEQTSAAVHASLRSELTRTYKCVTHTPEQSALGQRRENRTSSNHKNRHSVFSQIAAHINVSDHDAIYIHLFVCVCIYWAQSVI